MANQENAPANMGNLRRDIGDKFTWDVVMHPRGRNGKYVAAGGGAGWAVDAATGAKDATWAFLKHVTSSEEQIRLCQLGGTIGARRSVMSNACFLQTPPKNVKLFIDGTDYLHVDVRVAGWSEVSRILDEELKSLWDGSQPAWRRHQGPRRSGAEGRGPEGRRLTRPDRIGRPAGAAGARGGVFPVTAPAMATPAALGPIR